jgi:hypothetical protein
LLVIHPTQLEHAMLNTLPPSPAIRRRGGQPSNRNALRHGLYARRNPTPLAHLLKSIPVPRPGLDRIPEVLSQAVMSIRAQIARLFASSPQGADLRSILAWQRPILHLLGLFIRTQKALARLQQPQLQLQFVAAHALALIRYDFRQNGITRDAYSFREKNELSDLNSPACQEHGLTSVAYSFREKNQLSDLNSSFFQEDASPSASDTPHSFLSPGQLQVLEQLLPSPNPEDLGRGRERGRPPSDPCPLIDAIFWKIARHARWQDLATEADKNHPSPNPHVSPYGEDLERGRG